VNPERRPRPPLRDRLALALASGLGFGFAPVVPGTFGSIPGLTLGWILSILGGPWTLAAGVLVVSAAGLWAADRAAVLVGRNDPGCVVIDEVAGQMTSLLFLPPTPAVLAAAFVLFRALDILKPFPARRLEDLPGGSGIMADDLVAGLYANLALQAAIGLSPSVASWLGAA
jgi:phosphatidylglycerophosphatase A